MRNTKNAFTLVELIVVITILAILGTIAFISLQGYSADARNSKRTSDIGNIQSAISLKMVEGVPLLSFINDSANKLDTVSLGGSGAYTGDNYIAGTPNYTVLNVIAKDFVDPKSDKAYRIGATGLAGGVFQVAATVEQDGTDTALVNGTYANRLATAFSGTADGTSFSLDDNNANRFKVGDSIETQGNTGFTIQKVSRDGVTLSFATSIAGATALNLVANETAGLISGLNESGVATDTPVVNLSTSVLPY